MQSIRDFKKIGNVFWADHRMLLAAGYKAYSSHALCKRGPCLDFMPICVLAVGLHILRSSQRIFPTTACCWIEVTSSEDTKHFPHGKTSRHIVLQGI
jgi:hypothetical protein